MATGHDIAMSLRAAYLSMHRQTNFFLAPYDLTADQFVLLALLAEEHGITQQQLTQRACSDPNTIRAMLVLMGEKGLIERSKHPEDGRALKVTLTAKGKRLHDKVTVKIKPLQDAVISPFKTNHAGKLVNFLNGITESMTQWENNRK